MSLDSLGNKQTIISHNCEIKREKYDFLITPYKQTKRHIRTKQQTITRIILSKQIQITRKKFSKRRNAVSKSETIKLEELYRLKDSLYKTYQDNDTLNFSDSETTSQSSIQGKR